MRALFESLGIKDVVAKSTGTSNPHNMLKATLNAFKMSESPKSVAAKRSKKINEINLKTEVKINMKINELKSPLSQIKKEREEEEAQVLV